MGRAIITVAYRGIETETMREANLFRWSNDLGATIFLDVKNIWRKAEKENSEDILLKRFESGAKVARVLYPERGPFNDTVYFDIYGPTVIATNETMNNIFATRCLSITMPDASEKIWPDLEPAAALDLKERLTAFRARHLVKPLPEYGKPASGRLGDILRPLGVMMSLVSPDNNKIFDELVKFFVNERNQDRAASIDANLIAALDKSINGDMDILIKDITVNYNEGLPEKHILRPETIGHKLHFLGFKPGKQQKGLKTIAFSNSRSEIEDVKSNRDLFIQLKKHYGLYENDEQATA